MPSSVPTSVPAPAWKLRHSLMLAGIAAVGLGLRLVLALRLPWHWDEGYVAELARCLGALHRPQLGGLWQDGFFPLSTSILAPLSAAPFASAPWWSPMTGVRVWAVVLEAAALGLVTFLAYGGNRPRRALWAAACYAFLPFAVEFGARGFYHHFAVLFLLLTLVLGRPIFEKDRSGAWRSASLCAGVAAASCYWLWWLPASWAALLVLKRPRGWLGALPWMAVAPLLVLVVNVWPDPPGALWSIRGLLHITHPSGALVRPWDWLRDVGSNFKGLPFLAIGLVGLAWAARREGGAWAWILACLACAILEPVRQRGDIASLPYPFIPAAPLAALGAAFLVDSAWAPARPRGAVVSALALALWLFPPDMTWMNLWSFSPDKVAELKGFLEQRGRPGDLVCGLPNFNWALRPDFRVCEPFDVGAAEGRPSGFYGTGAPPSRFATPCRLEDVRFAVSTRVHLLDLYRYDGVALTFLEMERQGWPLVFTDKTFKVFENPRFGVPADPGTHILENTNGYKTAAAQARSGGLGELGTFADARAAGR